MTTNFSPDTFNILNFSKEEASRLHCGSVSPLHLLLGIIRHTDNKASQLLAYYLPDGVAQLKTQLEMTARQHQVLISPTPADMNFDTQANRIMRLCKLEASLMKSETIEPIHVLLAILKANDNEASDILQRLDITYDKVNSQQTPDNRLPNDEDDDEDADYASPIISSNRSVADVNNIHNVENAIKYISSTYPKLAKLFKSVIKKIGTPRVKIVISNKEGETSIINGVERQKQGNTHQDKYGNWEIILYKNTKNPQ